MSSISSSDDESAFSRGVSSPLVGKRTEPAKTSLTVTEKADFNRAWLEAGYMSEADCLRDLVDLFVYGREHLVSLRERQLAALVVNRPDKGPTQGQRASE
jgi:hypothetical protein